jgi:hypothetical protein
MTVNMRTFATGPGHPARIESEAFHSAEERTGDTGGRR